MHQIRQLTSPDDSALRQITELYRAAGWWWEEGEHLDFAKRLIKGSFCFYVAELDRNIVGIGRAISDGVSDAYIQDVTVKQTQRGQGIGSELIRSIITNLRKHGIDWIGLIAEHGSHPFYENLGMTSMLNATPMLYLPGKHHN